MREVDYLSVHEVIFVLFQIEQVIKIFILFLPVICTSLTYYKKLKVPRLFLAQSDQLHLHITNLLILKSIRGSFNSQDPPLYNWSFSCPEYIQLHAPDLGTSVLVSYIVLNLVLVT